MNTAQLRTIAVQGALIGCVLAQFMHFGVQLSAAGVGSPTHQARVCPFIFSKAVGPAFLDIARDPAFRARHTQEGFLCSWYISSYGNTCAFLGVV